MRASPLRVGLVGAGAIAQTHAQVLAASAAARIVGVADLRPEVARTLAEDLGCPSYDCHKRLADEARCEALIVCTPPASHVPICLDLLQRGLPVLCEKPLALDAAGARSMLDEAARRGTLLTMATKFRFVEDVVRAKSLVASGALGEITLCENAFASRVDMSARWNSDPAVAGGGVLIDNGTHSVDLVRYLLGPIEAVACVEGRRVQKLGVEDTVQLSMRTASGVIATARLSWSLQMELESFLDLYGSQGVARIGWSASRYRAASSPDWVAFGRGYDKLEAFAHQLENFVGAVRGEAPLRVGAEDALASVAAIEAAYASLRSGAWVALPETS